MGRAKVPNPKIYFYQQAKVLEQENLALFKELASFRFAYWIPHKDIQDKVMFWAKNEHSYGKNTFVESLCNAVHFRALMKSTFKSKVTTHALNDNGECVLCKFDLLEWWWLANISKKDTTQPICEYKEVG